MTYWDKVSRSARSSSMLVSVYLRGGGGGGREWMDGRGGGVNGYPIIWPTDTFSKDTASRSARSSNMVVSEYWRGRREGRGVVEGSHLIWPNEIFSTDTASRSARYSSAVVSGYWRGRGWGWRRRGGEGVEGSHIIWLTEIFSTDTVSRSARSSNVVGSVTGGEGGRGRYKCRALPLNMTYRDLLNRNGESVSQILKRRGVGVLRGGKRVVQQGKLQNVTRSEYKAST